MFINDVHRKEEIRNIAIQHLRKYGIKYRPKKPRPPAQAPRYGRKFFKVPLQILETETITLTNGQQLLIPKRIHEICSYILSKVQTEGIFRKEGSKSRQNEIKLSLDRGCLLGEEHHVIDVAVVLKCFLRELPEPLIPPAYNDLFLICSLEKRSRENILECLLLACLLLPSENLNMLSYLMQFFYEVAGFSMCNKMNFSNLSILVGPNIFPMDDKLAPKSSLTITRICDITRLLIENSRSIGVIPDYIIDQIGQLSDIENEKRRKNKRRSGSLTRMLNGLKKIVGSKTDEESVTTYMVTPDLLTPTIHASVKKRKGEMGLSLKKKKEVITKLPDCALLNTPFTPSRTPVSVNPNGKKNPDDLDNGIDNAKEKKLHWYMRSRSMKSLKEDESISSSTTTNTRRNSLGPKSMLERRWSAVSSAANFRKKKRNSCAATKKEIAIVNRHVEKPDEPDYVRVSKTEYEDFKNRVSAIERRISIELDNVHQSHMASDNDNNVNREIADGRDDNNIENVQTAYEKTLETGSLSTTTDQLARRLSRDLRIRRSAEQKIIRSPSARKIGTIRRRSTEREKKNAQIVRNQSWHVGGTSVPGVCVAPLLPRISTRRKKRLGKDEAIISQMDLEPQVTPPPTITTQPTNLQRSTSVPKNSGGRRTNNSLTRVSSSPCTFTIENSFVHQSSPQCASMVDLSDSGLSHTTHYSTCNTSGTSNEHWMSAEGFFNASKTPQEGATSANARASIAKLRTQNIGMVRAKARLFDNLKDSDTSFSSTTTASPAQSNSTKKVSRSAGKNVSIRSAESARMSYRIKALRAEDKRNKKNSISPRRRQVNMSQKQRLQYIGRQYVRCSKEVGSSSMEISQGSADLNTPRNRKTLNTSDAVMMSPRRTPRLQHNVPYIKAPLTVKTPKRLCRTPAVDKKTPFRVVATPM